MTIQERLRQHREYIVSRYNSGISTVKLGKEFNCNPGTIYLLLKESNAEIRNQRKTFTNEVKSLVVDEYSKGAGSTELMKKYNVSKFSILRWVKSAGLQTHEPTYDVNNLLRDKVDLVKQLHNEGKSQEEIAKITGHQGPSICNLIKKLNLEPRDWKYHVDEHFFDVIDSQEKAYVLGWFYSDGCVNNKGKLRIQLQSEDRIILEQIRELMKYDGPLHEIPARGTTKAMTGLCINRKPLCDSLIALGCVPRKSLILNFPTLDMVPKYLQNHFVRGYFDGDGSISMTRKRSGYIAITSTDVFLHGLQEILKELGVRSQLYYRYKTTCTASLMITYQEGMQKFLNYIYGGSTIHLPRKKSKVDAFLKNITFPLC